MSTRIITLVCVEYISFVFISVGKMGNCHTVGPNEALVVSGNVADRGRCVSARRVFSCLVEFDEVFIGKDPINRQKSNV